MSKLEIKDLINVGIFGVLYYVIFYAVGMLQLIPVLFPFCPIIMAIAGGIPFMLFITRVEKFGMITLMGIIISILIFLTGMSYLTVLTGLIFPILADLLIRSGKFKDFKKIAIGTGVFSLWSFGGFLPLWIMRDSYKEMMAQGYGVEYANTVFSLVPDWSIIAYIVMIVIGGIIGAYLGRAMLKKHFERAGIA